MYLVNTAIARKFSIKMLDALNLFVAPVDGLLNRNTKEESPPLFIIGAPRSGTTLTYQLVTQYFDVGYFCTPFNYFYGIPNILSYLLKPLMQQPPSTYESHYGKIEGLLSPAEPANFWFRWFPRDGAQGHYISADEIDIYDQKILHDIVYSISSVFKKPMVFKNVYLTMAAGALAQIFPEARFLLVRRNMLNIVQSMLKAREYHSRMQWWSVKPPEYKTLLNHPLWKQATYQVFMSDMTAQKELSQYAPERFQIIQYEDLCSRPKMWLSCFGESMNSIGYVVRDKVSIPDAFSPKTEILLSKNLTAKIQEYLEILNQRYG